MTRFEVLGVPLELTVADARLLALARGCLFPPRSDSDAQPLRFQIDAATKTDPAWPDEPSFRLEGTWFRLAGPYGEGWADQTTGLAHARVSAESGLEWDAQTLIETLAVFLAYARRPIVLHAAAIETESKCVLVTGTDGSGKSTLAYACHRSGMRLIADDVVYLSDPTSSIAWGHPTAMYLLPDAVSLFPELKGARVVSRLNGEKKLRINLLEGNPGSVPPCHTVHGVVTLRLALGAPAEIEEVDCAEIVQSLTHLRGDLPLNSVAMAKAANSLAALPHVRLLSGGDPEDAVTKLRSWMADLPR
jgi:hypothetical protein